MEKYKIEQDIKLFYVQADSFPISAYLSDWKKDESIIGRTFQELLRDRHIDKQGFCLEIYPNEKDVQCLVPLR
jgi:hypothetical protein